MEIAESACDAAVDFDDAVDGFGAAVTRPGGAEVGQELVLGTQGAALSSDLGDGQVWNPSMILTAIARPFGEALVW